jgi:hypothetical protein
MTISVSQGEGVYRSYIAGENTRDRAAMKACLSPTMVVAINGVERLADRDADAVATDRLLAAYPAYLREVVALHSSAQGDKVVVVAEWTMQGAGDGERVPELDTAGCTIATIALEDGRPVIVSARLYTDPAALDHIL